MKDTRWWTVAGMVLGFSTLFAVVHASILYFRLRNVDWWAFAVPRGLIDWYLWAFLSVPIFLTVRLLLETKLRGLALVLVHVPIALVFTLTYMVVNTWISISTVDPELSFEELMDSFIDVSMSHLSIYTGIVAACYAFLYYRPALLASQLEGRLTKAKLQALQMQLHPHFLFNTLNSISVLIHRDPDLADRMITRLSDLLRVTLASGNRQKVPLREELDILDKYMEIELMRFQNRLRVVRDIDPAALPASVPAMMLQPLVENAIRHGIARRSAAGCIEVSAQRQGERLVLQVSDDGPGISGSQEQVIGKGVGLANTRERLQQLYGDEQSFELIQRNGQGLTVRLRLPYEESLDDSLVGSITATRSKTNGH